MDTPPAAPPPADRPVEVEVIADGDRRFVRVRAPGFALPAALRAAYHRIGDFHVACDLDGDAPVILLSPKRTQDQGALLEVGERLARALGEAELQVDLLDRNRADREYAFARALFGAPAADQERMLAELSAQGAGDDPLGIAVPWEEKYGKKDR